MANVPNVPNVPATESPVEPEAEKRADEAPGEPPTIGEVKEAAAPESRAAEPGPAEPVSPAPNEAAPAAPTEAASAAPTDAAAAPTAAATAAPTDAAAAPTEAATAAPTEEAPAELQVADVDLDVEAEPAPDAAATQESPAAASADTSEDELTPARPEAVAALIFGSALPVPTATLPPPTGSGAAPSSEAAATADVDEASDGRVALPMSETLSTITLTAEEPPTLAHDDDRTVISAAPVPVEVTQPGAELEVLESVAVAGRASAPIPASPALARMAAQPPRRSTIEVVREIARRRHEMSGAQLLGLVLAAGLAGGLLTRAVASDPLPSTPTVHITESSPPRGPVIVATPPTPPEPPPAAAAPPSTTKAKTAPRRANQRAQVALPGPK